MSKLWDDLIGIEGYGSAQKQLNQDILRRFSVRCPPLSEQVFWVHRCNEIIKLYSQAIHSVETSISKLGNYLSALITAAVTGQIDVTTWKKHSHNDQSLEEIKVVMDTHGQSVLKEALT